MAGGNGRVNVEVGFSVDKSGLTQMQSLFQQIANKAKEPGVNLTTELQKAASTANTLDQILEKTFNTELGTLNVTKFNQELNKSGLTLKSVKSDLTAIGNQGATAYNRLAQAVLGTNQQLKQTSKTLDQIAITFKNTVRYGISSSIFNNMTNAIRRAFDYSKQLDTSLNDIRIVTDKSAENMDRFAEKANQAAKDLGASTLDYTNAALIYYQQGLSDEETAARAETTIKAANVTGQTGQEVSEQLTAVWNGYKATAAETELYVDKLAAVAATTAADLEELSTGMSKVAAAANAMGVDFDDLNAQIATIVSVTRQAPESVGTALKTIYARLGDLKVDGVDEFGVKLGEVSAQLETMGIQILDQNGDLRDMTSVMAEVAEKWNTWTRAQQQAAAVAMAGKRQYNNLVALFENWDMYSDALETSANAMGTLQHQQDIYMQSTEAKLKTLKATWQDLYKGIIDEDELNTGIDALTNLVQVVDNFFDSFGGGIKSISAFGTIIANIFNRQIADSINGVIQRQEIFKQNLALAQANANIRAQGVAQVGSNATAQDLAIEANTKTQLEYAQKIYDVRVGLNQEQYNGLINQQKELGFLKEKITFNEQIIKKLDQEYQLTEQYGKLQEWNGETIEKINLDYDDRIRKAEQIKNLITDIVTGETNIGAAKTKIASLTKSINTEEAKQVQEVINFCDTTYDIEVNEDKINKLLNDQISKYKNIQTAAEKINDSRIKNIDLNANYQNTKQEADEMLRLAANARSVTQTVTTITSALGSMAMAWSSVNSLFQTWNDETASFGDKLTQTFMTVGFTLPMVISSFSKLDDVLNISLSSTAKAIAADQALAESKRLTATEIAAKQAHEEADTLWTQYNTIAEEYAISASEERGIVEALEAKAIDASAKAEALDAQAKLENKAAEEMQILTSKGHLIAKGREIYTILAHKSALDADTQAAILNKAAIIGTIAVAALLVTTIALVVKWQQKQLEQQIKINDAEIEHANKVQEEVNANKELYDSYSKLYNQYKNNEVEKEALYDITDQLCEKYNLEGGYLAKLTGDYEKLTSAIKETRKAELEEAINASKKEVGAASSNLLPTARQDRGYLIGSQYKLSTSQGFGSGLGISDEQEVLKYLQNVTGAKISKSFGDIGDITFTINGKDPKELVQLYDELTEQISLMNQELDPTILSKSESYSVITEWLTSMQESVEEYRTSLEELDNYQVQMAFFNADLDRTNSVEDYQNKIAQVREELLNLFDGDQEKVNSLIETYVSEIDNEFLQLEVGIDTLGKELGLTEDQIKELHNWSQENKIALFSGQIDFEGYTKDNFDNLKKEVELVQQRANSEDLSVVVSLREKMASDKKLTKTQVKEAAGETSTLAQDYDVLLSDFDNQSQLKQVETLNQIANDKIEINRRYIQNAKETAEQEKEIQQDRFDTLEQERKALVEKRKLANMPGSGVIISEEEIDRLEELESILPGIAQEIESLQDIADNGLSFEEIDDLNFDNIIAGIDGIITEAEVLKNLAEDVGENWTIAADDIERFGENFPELLAAQENYNFLQDGSLQLTEQGVAAFQDMVNARKADLEASNEAYQIELQKQADLQIATAEYYEDQATQLKEYLAGHQSAAQTEANLKQGTYNFTKRLSELTGQDNETLTNIIEENYDKAAQTNSLDAQDIYDNYVAIGNVAAAASQAFLAGEFVDPGLRPVGGGGHSVAASTFTSSARDVDSGDYLKEISEAEIQDMIDSAEAAAEKARNRAADYISKKAGVGASVGAATHTMEGAASGKGGKDSKSKSGGGKDKKDKEDKKLEDEFDRYWEIKKAIDAVDRALSKLDKDQENLYGYELIKSLKLENQLLEQQAGNYRALAEAQKQEAAELQGVLSGYGVAFDASGAITNYAAATAAALQEYNDAIHQYNMGLIDESTLGVYEKNYEKFKKALERYDTLFYQEMKDTEEKLEEIRRKELANNLKAWQVEIQLKLDMKDLERQWNDFITKVQKDFQRVYSDLRVDLKSMLNDAYTYTGSEGTIATIINGVHDVTQEIDKMRFGGTSDMFESISQAQEELKDLNQKLLDAGEALHDLWEQAWDNYLDGIDQVADQFDDLIDRFERIDDELEFQGKLIELLYGEEAYGLMNKLYQGQEHNMEAQINSLKQQKDMWEQLFYASGATLDNQTEWTEDQKKYYDEWMDAQSDLNNLVLDYIELLKTDYLNTVKDVLKQFETFVSGSSLDHLADQWDRIADRADKYYDSVEGAYEVQNLANKMDESISNEANLRVQQKLQALRDKEIKYLREKENLTEYDLQAAEARFQIALKEAALEDARNNKTSMKLTRNEQGNWSYQYIADEDEVLNKRQELLDAYSQLYQLASDAYEANLEALQKLQQTYLDKAQEIYESEVLSEEEKQEQLLELRQWYLEEYKLLAEENTLYRNDLEEGAAALLLEIYNQDQTAYQYMTEAERALLDELINAHIDGFLDLEERLKENYNNIGDKAAAVMADTRADWTSGAQTIADIWNGDNGFSVRVQVLNAYDAINQASQRYKDLVDWCAAAVARDFSEEGIAGAIMRAEQETDNLSGKTAELVNNSIPYLNQLRAYVELIADAWRSVQQAIMDAIGLIQEYLRYIGDVSAAVESANAAAARGYAESPSASRSGSGNETGTRNGANTSSSSNIVRRWNDGTWTVGQEGHGTITDPVVADSGTSGLNYDLWKKNTIAQNQGRTYGYSSGSPAFATGGYTGEWNNGSQDGRLAWLHQKELVLNETDTANFLKGINTLRDMTSTNGSIENSILKSVAGMALSLTGIKPGLIQGGSTTTNDTSNVFNIQAEFPNANNVDEIREAILTLPNIASQRANLNLR